MSYAVAHQEAQASSTSEMHRVLFSSYIGSVVEYYDFLLYGLAASLVFGKLFFSSLDPSVGIIASFGTLAAGYFARPIGGILFGHFGDSLGRKSMLMITMLLMGISSALIGFLPTYSQVGICAPLLLVFLRVLQGIALGGEWGGAVLMSLEHANSLRRGFASSVTNMGAPSGALLATVVFTAISFIPEDQFMSWGWRVPFILSTILVVIALWVRTRISESPLFVEAIAKQSATVKGQTGYPLFDLFRSGPKPILISALGTVSLFAFQNLAAAFSLQYAMTVGGHSRSDVLIAFSVASFFQIIATGIYARISDSVGRRPVMLFGNIAAIIVVYPMFLVIGHSSLWGLIGAMCVFTAVAQAAMAGPAAAYISEMFATTGRYTGASLGYQLASTFGGGLTPLVAAAIMPLHGIVGVSVYVTALLAVSTIVLLLSKETHQKDLRS